MGDESAWKSRAFLDYILCRGTKRTTKIVRSLFLVSRRLPRATTLCRGLKRRRAESLSKLRRCSAGGSGEVERLGEAIGVDIRGVELAARRMIIHISKVGINSQEMRRIFNHETDE